MKPEKNWTCIQAYLTRKKKTILHSD